EAADHLTADDVVVGAIGSVGPLPREDPEEIAVIGRRAACLVAPISLGSRPRHQGAQRARRLIGLRLPEQTVALARRACEFLGVLQHAVAAVILFVVLPLRVDVRQGRLNRVQLVAADAPRKDFLAALARVESPLLAGLDDRNGKRPFVLSY